MAFSKAHLFPQPIAEQSFWAKALAHPARVIILDHLVENGTTPFKVLSKLIPLAPTTVSQHLRQLRTAHIVEAFEKFPHTHYTVNQNLCTELAIRLTELQARFIA